MKTMAEEDFEAGRSTFRGHAIIVSDGEWVYENDGSPIPAGGGEARPCAVCGQESWSGDGAVDQCLGVLPGVVNACCGHGDTSKAYIVFENGFFITGFQVRNQEG